MPKVTQVVRCDARGADLIKTLSRVRLLATPWTAAYQAPLSIGISRQEYWSGVPRLCQSDYFSKPMTQSNRILWQWCVG